MRRKGERKGYFYPRQGAVGPERLMSELPSGKLPFLPLPNVIGCPLLSLHLLAPAVPPTSLPHTETAYVGPIGPVDFCFKPWQGGGPGRHSQLTVTAHPLTHHLTLSLQFVGRVPTCTRPSRFPLPLEFILTHNFHLVSMSQHFSCPQL